jgi:hypothetical protein
LTNVYADRRAYNGIHGNSISAGQDSHFLRRTKRKLEINREASPTDKGSLRDWG